MEKKNTQDYSHTLLTLLQSLPLPSPSPLPLPQSIQPWRPSRYSPDPCDLCLLLCGTRIRDTNSGNFSFRVIACVYMKKKYTDTVSSSRNFMKIWIIHYVATQWGKKKQQLWHLWIVLTENYKCGVCLTLLSQTNTISGKDYFKQWHTLGLLTRRNVFPEKTCKETLN